MLVVKNSSYVKLANKCVRSFLFFHPNSKIVVHVDSSTHKLCRSVFSDLIKKFLVNLKEIENCDSQIWQVAKVNLILNLNGGNAFVMNADLNWNGPLPTLHGPTLFTKEFSFQNKSPYREIEQAYFKDFSTSISMYNTSFVFHGSSGEIVRQFKVELDRAWSIILQSIEADLIGRDDQIFVSRLIEQIAISVAFPLAFGQVGVLKDVDQINDGRFVESSYFGATSGANE